MSPRYPVIDALRGFAILLMVVYHFLFDLSYFGVAAFDFYTGAGWIGFRTLIVTLFLLVSGGSLQLAAAGGLNHRRYLRRLAWLSLCAVLVSVATYISFGERWVSFGILHFIAVASVLGLIWLRLPRLQLPVGIALIVLGSVYQNDVFDAPALQWLGMMTHKPATEDYVPLLPWLGVFLLGMAAGRSLLSNDLLARLPDKLSGGPAALLAVAGRHSLLIYMLHQPLLLGGLWLVLQAAGRA